MKMRKIALGAFLGLTLSFSALAQSNPGADYLSLGEVQMAKDYFTKNLGQNAAEANYYLGEIEFKAGNLDQAKSYYEKALAANPEYAYALIGLAKLELKSDPKEAEKKLNEIQKKNKKDVQVILAITKAFQDNGMTELAAKKLEDARKADKKSPWVYVYEGDLLAVQNKPGEAGAQYDQAINFDPNCVIAYLKGAQVYEYINAATAMSLLKTAAEKDPNYSLVYKLMGKIGTQTGHYQDAIDAYKKYFQQGDYATIDLQRYASSYYFLKEYNEAIPLIEKGLEKEPNNFVLNRLMMYSLNETQDYISALPVAERFFNIPLNEKDTIMKYIDRDYLAYAKILSETGNKTGAIEQYKKAIALDPSRSDLYKDIATASAEEGLNAIAAEFYKKYIELLADKVEPTDFYQLGRYYYAAGTAAIDTTVVISEADIAAVKAEHKGYLKEADSAFATVAERIPESYLGLLWRARTNASLDPETIDGLAKPFYEQTIARILAKDDHENNRELSESYRYLSYFHYLRFEKTKSAEEKAKVVEYCDKMLELDPANTMAKQLKEYVLQ